MQDATNSDMDRVLLGRTKDVKEWQQVKFKLGQRRHIAYLVHRLDRLFLHNEPGFFIREVKVTGVKYLS